MRPFTVISFNDETGQSYMDHVMAIDLTHANFVGAHKRELEEPDVNFVCALPGHLKEEDGQILFTGESVVDGATILTQPEVFDVCSRQ